MHGENHPQKRALRQARDETVQRLRAAFAEDEIGLDEFDARVQEALRAEDAGALDALLEDLSTPAQLPVPIQAALPSPAASGPARGPTISRALFSSVERRGRWTVPAHLVASATLGSIVLDLREASLPDELVTIEAKAFFGNVEILTPPGLGVEVDGSGLFGNVSSKADGGGPVRVRVTGRALFGNVEVRTPRDNLLVAAAKKLLGG